MTNRLILASGSPRRRELLQKLGLPFRVARPDIDETPHVGEAPDAYVARLSVEKGSAAVAAIRRGDDVGSSVDSLLITADTTVADGSTILGKPTDASEAFAMLARLRGRTHLVHTGLTITDVSTGHHETIVTTSRVEMRSYPDAAIQAYIARGEPYDKAGGYAIQDAVFKPVAHFEGCYTNIMGLPLCVLCGELRKAHVDPVYVPACSPMTDRCEFGM
jgi:MAF protein